MQIMVRTTLPDGSCEQVHESQYVDDIRAINAAELIRPGAVVREIVIRKVVIGRCAKCNVPLFDGDKIRQRGGRPLCPDCL